ncbi:MAG: polysaccharide pyruvyl transferase family protein [Clostridium sp.]
MKIGIMSMQRVKNYGSFLQAFGLKKTIEGLGHEVVFVDYEVEPPIVPYKVEGKLYKSMRYLYHKFKKCILKQNKLYYVYNDKYLPMLGISNESNYRNKVDILVIGSDEVFNCLQSGINVGYSKELFGKNNNAGKVISYAGSFGYTTLDGLKKHKIDKEVGEMLSKFFSISIRDNNSFEIVKKLTGKEPIINVDPVIISNFDKYIPEQNKLKDYILIYAYNNRIKNEDEIFAIKEFAKKHNKKLVSVGVHQEWTDIKLEGDPFELLSYVKNSDYVITDTFHGSIFSIKYNRPFGTIIRESNRQKLGDLLQRFDVMDREITNMNNLESVLLKSIDFNKINKIIEEETNNAIFYLQNALD